jgi:APA family basic amino acid/polyamine antiporter
MNSLPKLGLWASLSLIIGNIIGVGIFTTTGYMTQYIQSPMLVLSAWAVGGMYALSGAVVYGTLARKYPQSGGDYIYLTRGLHPALGYMFGWSAFFVTYSGSIAALAIGAAYYFGSTAALPLMEDTIIHLGSIVSISWAKLCAVGLITFLSWINYKGITLSGRYQITLTAGIVLFMIMFILSGIFSEKSDIQILLTDNDHSTSFPQYLTSLLAVLFAYMGWTTAVYVAEEIKRAREILPKILVIGVLVVTLIYICINIIYLITVPVSDMVDVINIGSLVAHKLYGESGNLIVSFLILIAILGSLNSTILSGPRIYMAMGRDGFFLKQTQKLHKRFFTPYVALVLQAIWSIFLVVSGSFNDLLAFVVFIAILFSFMAAFICVRILIKSKPMPYGQLILAGFYTLFCLMIMLNTVWQQPVQSLIGLSLTLLALPFYFIEQKVLTV